MHHLHTQRRKMGLLGARVAAISGRGSERRGRNEPPVAEGTVQEEPEEILRDDLLKRRIRWRKRTREEEWRS